NPDVSTRLLHNSIHSGETETGAFTGVLGGEERIERLLARVAIPSDPGVATRQHYVAPGNDGRVLAGVRLIELHILGLDGNGSALRHRVARVDYQVDEYLLDLTGIRYDVA